MITKVILGIFVVILTMFSGYNINRNNICEDRLNVKLDYIESENRLLRDKVNYLQSKPDYDKGYNDCLIHMAGGNGSFRKGFEAGVKLTNNAEFSSGYHAAISQFEYFGEMLVPVIKKAEDCPAHLGGKK